ncbi:MAG: zinc-dependent peptidase [Bacteroidetes bacterium]|nr:zinc-dependent peptidase [Bacteroidota bacterium]
MAALFILLFISVGIALLIRGQQRKKLQKIGSYQLPANTKNMLSENVAFYRGLSDADRVTFEERVRDFLARTSITGVGGVQVTDSDRLLVASAAIIPIFSFPDWRYNNIDEVLLYNGAFNKEYEQQGDGRDIVGMVGSGAMQGQMILSQPALRSSFQHPADGHNTAIHEFVHLLDKADGAVDGVPEYLLSKPYIIPWLKYMREMIQSIREKGRSDINYYAATNEAEFLAVLAEYFFEKPQQLRAHHPELYQLLDRMFRPPNK